MHLGQKKQFNINNMPIKWEFIEKLEEVQSSEGVRLANKLTPRHVQWQNECKIGHSNTK